MRFEFSLMAGLALLMEPTVGVGQFYGTNGTEAAPKSCLSDWSKSTPVMRDHVDDTFYLVLIWIHACSFLVLMACFPVQWWQDKPVDGETNLLWHTRLGNVIRFCIWNLLLTGTIGLICRATYLPYGPTASDPCVRRQIPTEVQWRTAGSFAICLSAQMLHAFITRGGRAWSKTLCQVVSGVGTVYWIYMFVTVVNIAVNFTMEDTAVTAFAGQDYTDYVKEMATETLLIVFPLPIFDVVNIWVLHSRFHLFDPETAGEEQARHAWVQHHKFNMIVVGVMAWFVLPGMWVAHDAYWFFDPPGIQSMWVRFFIQAAIPYAFLLYPKNLTFVLSYIFCPETSSLPSDDASKMVSDKDTTATSMVLDPASGGKI